MPAAQQKKLIEVLIPLEAINKASAKEKSIRHGHPSTLHLWWARRPLAACRAVLFAQLVDDPSAWPDRFPREEDQSRERERLHQIIKEMVPWEATNNALILDRARYEIARSVAWGRGEEPPPKDDGQAVLAYLQEKAPPVYDPFCGGGSIPLEAQRLGLRAYGSDLNPVAVLISKALVEIPPKFAGRPPVNPDHDRHRSWKGAEGLADDVRYYGRWMRDEAEKRIGHLYPTATLPDGREATVIAWLWARTVASPDPSLKGGHVPLVSSFMLSTKKGKQAWVEIVRDRAAQDGWRFEVKTGTLTEKEEEKLREGTKAGRGSNFVCARSGAAISGDHIKAEGMAGRMTARLMAIVAENPNKRPSLAASLEGEGEDWSGRLYLPPMDAHEASARIAHDSGTVRDARDGFLNQPTPKRLTGGTCYGYGLTTFGRLFTTRQVLALTTFSDLAREARERAIADAHAAGLLKGGALASGGTGVVAYADAMATYLSLGIGRLSDIQNALCRWESSKTQVRNLFGRQSIPMVWDYAENNAFNDAAGDFRTSLENLVKALEHTPAVKTGSVISNDAAGGFPVRDVCISTDPPYYDNVGYADLSDFFYVWLRRSLKDIWPGLFRRTLTPKDEELVAIPYRFGGKEAAEEHFMKGMKQALGNARGAATNSAPITIYYAYKQAEVAGDGLTSPGWTTFLQAVSDTGFAIDGTWPLRTELGNRMVGIGANVLASSIVLVCRKRAARAPTAIRRDFVSQIESEMPRALREIVAAGVGPVDMTQAALGPGMGIFTSYARVIEPDDSTMSVGTAITLINQIRQEVLDREDAGYDAATRFCLDWFEAFGTAKGKSSDAITMANGYAIGLGDLERAGVFRARGGEAQLLSRGEMPEDWDPRTDRMLTYWEACQHLIRALTSGDGGELAAARLVALLRPDTAETVRTLAYRLYAICEKKGWAEEARAYNMLAEEWPRLKAASLDFRAESRPAQGALDLGEAATL